MRVYQNALTVLSLLMATIAQRPLAAQTADTLSLITPDAVATISLKPAVLAKSQAMRRLPLEVISATGMEYLGFDPLKLQSIDVFSGVPIPGPGGFPISMCVTHSEPIGQELLSRFLPAGPVTEKGVELWAIPQTPDFVLALRTPNQALIGPKAQVLRLMKTKPGDGELRKMVASLGSGAAFQFVVALEPLREILVESAQTPMLQSIPELVPNLTVVAQKSRMVSMRIESDKTTSTTYLLEGTSPSDTVELSKAMKNLIRLGTKVGLESLERELQNVEGKTPAATLAYARRMSTEAEAMLDFKPEGNRLFVKLEGQTMMVAQTGILAGLLLPAVQASREAARRMSGANNMKQILLAFHNYESAFRRVVSDVGPDPRNTKANLSWRVYLLPFIEQGELYKEFHLDEAWDSPHNIKLLARMPECYRDPRSVARLGHTVYHMPSGENMILDSTKRIKFSSITDGLSNTIALFVSNDEAAVPWTKPTDFDPIAQRDAIATSAGTMTVGLADGSIQSISDTITAEALEVMVIINDGQAVDEKYLKP